MTYGAGVVLSMDTYSNVICEKKNSKMFNTHGLDASLKETLQRKQKSVSIMVILQTITNYNKKSTLT